MKQETKDRIVRCVKEVLPSTTKTCIWIIKITVAVSFAMMLLKFFDILPWISNAVSPVFKIFGLPGAAALAYVSGYLVNVYSAVYWGSAPNPAAPACYRTVSHNGLR